VLVLATGRRSRPGGDESANRSHSTITVQVDPNQAQKLIVAQRGGRITAVLRGSDDRAQTKPVAMDVYSLIGARPTSTRTAAGPEIIVGGRGALPQREPAAGGAHVEVK
jgi:pilus assembly protein CpaB